MCTNAIIIQSDHWLHTEGFSLTSSNTKQSRQAFYDELQAFAGIIPFYESLSWILLALTGCFDSFRCTPNIYDEIISDLEGNSADDNSDSILVFATLFNIFKSYQNCIVVEISSILPGGILRCISLGSTEGF